MKIPTDVRAEFGRHGVKRVAVNHHPWREAFEAIACKGGTWLSGPDCKTPEAALDALLKWVVKNMVERGASK